MRTPPVHGLVPLLLLVMPLPSQSEAEWRTAVRAFEKDVVEVPSETGAGRRYPLRLLRPEDPDPERRYPVILFLHGAGERGTDNEKQLVHFPWKMATPRWRRDAPCFVLAPQCPEGERWVDTDWGARRSAPMKASPTPALAAARQALEDLLRDPAADPDRVYLTGLSMGGYGAWEMATRWPGRFAALVPICGGGDERRADGLRALPLWAFHGDRDRAVPVERSRSMVAAVRAAGGSPRYTELEGVGHASWRPAYDDAGAIPWMMAQRRAPPREHPDRPPPRSAVAWSCVAVDCARHPQSIETLEQVIALCSAFGIRYLQLHLTDDESFTFPSRAFPEVATAGRAYERDALVALERHARERGVLLIPEIDLPGHAGALVRARPERFGLADPAANPGLVNLGREETLAAIDVLLGEVCDVFPSTPFIHVGGDEVRYDGVAEDAACRARMEHEGLESPAALHRWFLGRVHAMLKARGRDTVVWEGFPEAVAPPVPEDLVVVVWDAEAARPAALARRGLRIVNASWKPLYVVGGGTLGDARAPRSWPIEELLAFDRWRFDHWDPAKPAFGGLRLPPERAVFGAQLCLWEQREWSVVPSLLPRLAAFALRLEARPGAKAGPEVRLRLERECARVGAAVQPVRVHPPLPEERPAHLFDDAVVVAMAANEPGIIRFTRDGSVPTPESPAFTAPFTVAATTTLRARLFDSEGRPRGGTTWARYEKTPPPRVRVLEYAAPSEGWPALPDFRTLPVRRGHRWPGVRGGLRLNPLGLVSEARLVVSEPGEHAFALHLDDGLGRLLIDGAEVLATKTAVAEGQVVRVRVGLAAGEHALRLEYAQGPRGCRCRVDVVVPGRQAACPLASLLAPLR